MEYARLPSVGASSDISGELLSGKSKWRLMPHSIGVGLWSRDTPKVPEGFSSGSRGRSISPGASALPYGGIPFGDFPTGLGHDLGHPERSLAQASTMYGLAHSCPGLYCPGVAVEAFGGASL